MTRQALAPHVFSMADLQWFAAASGDWNPIHVDAVAARRLLAGEVVVHGMYSLLWALECHCASGGAAASAISASFSRPILAGDQVSLTRELAEQNTVRLAIHRADEVVATILLAVGGDRFDGAPVPERPSRSEPEAHSFSELKGRSGRLRIKALPEDMLEAFPNATRVMGHMALAALMGLSRIVGMKCPGLHSLFTRVEVRLESAGAEPELGWKVERHSVPQAPLRIAVAGAGLAGWVDAFVRPEPVAQPSMKEVAARVPPESFAGQVALVVGGSRGLGELTAKVVVAGGGQVIVTYASGAEDALRVAREITAWGGECRVLEMHAEHPEAAIASLMAHGPSPTHVYYYAAARIGRSRNQSFDADVYRTLNQLFVEAFAGLVTNLAEVVTGDLKVFYPSSVFLDEVPEGYAEYIAAKAAGESTCRYLDKHLPGVQILVRRLPRLPTDQTSGLIRLATAEPVPEMLGVVHDMHALSKWDDPK